MEIRFLILYLQLKKLKTIPGNENLKILIAIGGWTYGTAGFTSMASTTESRRIFAQNAAKYIEENGMHFCQANKILVKIANS